MNRCRFPWPVLLCLICFSSVFAGTLDHNFDQGNDYYTNGDYVNAIREYEKIITAEYESAELYYNLGNAYFRQGQLGLAIINYERAARLDPGDDDIRANLEFARQFTIDRIEVTEETIVFDYINRFFDSFTINGITWINTILYIMAATFVLVRFIYRRYQIPTPIFSAVMILFVVATILTAAKFDRDILTRRGVVVVQQTDVKNGPGEDFNTKFTAHAGLMFKIEREEAGYYWVNFENRLKGWILKSVAAEI
jgi:tetratricopeptide (TPR) repeat protein